MLRDYGASDAEFAYVALRYFNVAGSAADGSLGEDHEPETHLIPVLLQAALGRREKVTVFGTDYPTPDGTCIRDYIHVEDLCAAHITAMEALRPGDARFYNLGIGTRLFGQGGDRRGPARDRPGDSAWSTALAGRAIRPCCTPTPTRFASELGWSAHYTQIEPIVATAWNWFKNHPDGYGE